MCIYDEENVMEIKTLMTILIMIEYHSSNKYFLNKFFPGWEGGGGKIITLYPHCSLRLKIVL